MRAVDVIPIRPTIDLPPLPMHRAWSDLRDLVRYKTGVDISGPHPFDIVVKNVGDDALQMLLCGPKGISDPETLLRNSYVSFFGNIPSGLRDYGEEMIAKGMRPALAIALADCAMTPTLRRLN